MERVKVAAGSNVKDVAWVVTQELREKERVDVQAIGAGAVNQMVKAIIIARGYLAPSGIRLICVPAFTEVECDENKRTAICFTIWADRR